jgi:uncharacterized protein (DUF1800 family)
MEGESMRALIRMMAVAAAWLIATPLAAQTYDLVYRGSFENVSDAPASDAEAARFLTQATFGPTRAEISRLRAIGYGQWLEQQLSMPPTLTRPWLDQLASDPTFSLNSGHRVDRFYWQALYAPDQLRQRMAFALSQILVVSDSGGIDTRMIAEYADLLTRGAFANYRTLLGEVTYSPTMGQWLTYVRSRAAYQSSGSTILPDENYAREVMQLFSFGLLRRNLDFSLQLSGGQPIPTYDNTIIAELARVFTGLSYGRTNYSGTSFGNNTNRDLMAPMVCFPMNNPPNNQNYLAGGRTFHDVASKTLFDSQPGQPVVLPAVIDSEADCNLDISRTLDAIAAHPSVAPFLSRQLIQRFTTSNPSPAYVQRVASVFNDNGLGVRGDLAAVIRAVLMDPDARAAPGGSFGKLREPVLRATALWRGLDTPPGQPQTGSNIGNIQSSLGFTNSDFGQRPYSAVTVFNFYEPDYQPPGAIANANLYSPEFQILNESTVTRMNNTLRNRITDTGWYSVTGVASCTDLTRPCVPLDPYVQIIQTANAASYGQLVDEMNLRVMGGSMSPSMRTVLLNMLTTLATPTTNAQRTDRVRDVLRLIIASPEFAVQK